MKKILLGAAALSMLAAPAFAQFAPVGPAAAPTTVSSVVAVTGSVAKQCGLGNQSGGGGNGGYTPTLALGSLVDGNGQLNVAAQNIGFGNVWCNSAATVALSTTQLTTLTPNTDPTSFTNKLDLIIDGQTGLGGSVFAYLGGATQATLAAPASASTAGAFETGTGAFQSARVRVALPSTSTSGDRPVAGAYTGTITFKVSTN